MHNIMGKPAEIRSVIEDFFHAMHTQNYELMERLIPVEENMVHIGTDKGEIWKGWNVLMSATHEQFKDLEYYKAEIRDLSVNFSSNHKTAWYFHYLDAEIKSTNGISKWEGARFTGVLEKREGSWKIMQTHVSLPESL